MEEHVNQMGPMIDAELEAVDRRHAQLTRLSTELVDALNLYHQLMHENMSAAAYGMAQQPPSMVSGREKIYQNKPKNSSNHIFAFFAFF